MTSLRWVSWQWNDRGFESLRKVRTSLVSEWVWMWRRSRNRNAVEYLEKIEVERVEDRAAVRSCAGKVDHVLSGLGATKDFVNVLFGAEL